MKNLQICFILATTFFAGAASADIPKHAPRIDSPELLALREKSKAQALGTQSLATYSRRAGIGNAAMSLKLRKVLPDLGLSAADIATGSEQDASGTILVTGRSWSLQTSGDGRHGRASLSAASLPSVDINARMSYDDVVNLGKGVLYGKLGGIIGLGASEKLPVQYVSYMGRFAMNPLGITTVSQVLASYVAFGRAINGVPVVGPGSFVKIGFDVTGKLISVDFDWSQFELTSNTQTTIAIDSITSRFAKLGGARAGVTVSSTECGYYDPGVEDQAVLGVLQPACVYSGKNGLSALRVAVPAGATFAPDSAWRETVVLSSQ